MSVLPRLSDIERDRALRELSGDLGRQLWATEIRVMKLMDHLDPPEMLGPVLVAKHRLEEFTQRFRKLADVISAHDQNEDPGSADPAIRSDSAVHRVRQEKIAQRAIRESAKSRAKELRAAIGRGPTAVPISAGYLAEIIGVLIWVQPDHIRDRIHFGSTFGEGRDRAWSGSTLRLLWFAPEADAEAIRSDINRFRERLQGLYLVETVSVSPFVEPATAGMFDEHGFPCRVVGERWSISVTVPVSVP